MSMSDIYASRVDELDRLIHTANETIKKAREVNAYWLIEAAEKEIIWARREREKYLKRLIERNGF